MVMTAWEFEMLYGDGTGRQTIGLIPQAHAFGKSGQVRDAIKAISEARYTMAMTPIGWSVEALRDLQAMIDHEAALPGPSRPLWREICHWRHPFPQPRPAATSALAYLEVIA